MFYLDEKKIKDMYNLKKENKREKIKEINVRMVVNYLIYSQMKKK